MTPLEQLEAKEKKLAGMLREVRKYTKGKTDMGGGWNKKTIEQHIANGTYRADRHGPLPSPVLSLKKPPSIITQTARAAAKWVRNASDEHAIRSGCRFNQRLADYAADFFPKYLRHSKGRWAGQPFDLTDWQRTEIIDPIFGWVNPDGTRRFRRTYIEIPKKNYKSTIASGIGIYMLAGDNEPGSLVWSMGADKDQAKIVHGEAINMIEASDELSRVLKINHTTGEIRFKATNSIYKAVSASPRGKHGPSLYCIIADELHEWYGRKLWENVKYAHRARDNSLFFVITNAGNDLQSVCYSQREKAKAILDGSLVDHTFFAMILAATQAEAEAEMADVENGITELPVARKCNPGLGHVIQESALVMDIKDALHTPSEMPNLLRLTYGIWNTGVNPWLSSADWTACQADFNEKSLEGCECAAGLDVAQVKDMTALTLIFPDEEQPGTFRQLAYFWMPEKTMRDNQHLVDYKAWVEAGLLRVGGGKVIETAIVEAEIQEIFSKFTVGQMAFDPMFVDESRISDVYPDVEMVKFPQTIMQYASPTAFYETLVTNGKLLHDGNDLLAWQAGHCCIKDDLSGNNNKRPIKPKPKDIRTIDGIVAGIMALRLLMNEDVGSAYEDGTAPMYADDIEYDDETDDMEYSGNEEEEGAYV
jgi:phage terminase large subunit-like protein